MLKKTLSISVIIPAHNEEINLVRLFSSLKKQAYPKNKIEYIVIDDNSNDKTFSLAKSFGARIIKVKTADIELNKGIGMHTARNDIVYWMDADMEVCGTDFYENLLSPLQENPEIVASFTKEFSFCGCDSKVTSSLLRFISYHPLQQDPLYAFFSHSIESTIFKRLGNYSLCRFIPGKIPAVGRIAYRRNILLQTSVGENKSFIDMESVEIMARSGHNLFAYAPEAKIRHYHAENLQSLIHKRLRNLDRDYLPNSEHKYFTWFDLENPNDIKKIMFWIVYANLFIPELIHGLFNILIHKDIAFLWQPVVAITTTDAILWGFLSKPKGRSITLKFFKTLTASIYG